MRGWRKLAMCGGFLAAVFPLDWMLISKVTDATDLTAFGICLAGLNGSIAAGVIGVATCNVIQAIKKKGDSK